MVLITSTMFVYLIPYVVALMVTSGVVLYTRRWRQVVGARAYGIVALSQALWTLGYIFELLSVSLEAKIFWDDLQYLAGVGWFFGFFVFSLQYTGRKWPRPWSFWVLYAFVPVAFAIIVVTGKFHGLIRPSAWLVPGEPFSALLYDFTPVVWGWAIYGYGIIIAGLINLIVTFLGAQRLYRAQIATVVVGTLIPLFGTLFSLMEVTQGVYRDATPLAFAVGNLIVAWGFYRFRMFDVVPIARYIIIEGMRDAIIVLDALNRVVDLNAAARSVIGDPPSASVIGRSVTEIFAQWSELVVRYLNVEQAHTEITLVVDGETKDFEFVISPLRDQVGLPIGRLITVRDISERLYFEASLRESEEKYRLLVESTADWVWTADLEGRNTFSNEAVEDLLGYEVDEVVGHFVFEFMHPDDRAKLGEELQRAMMQKTGWRGMAVRWMHKDGSARYFESTARPILNENADVVGFSGIDRDITERVRAERELQAHREQLEALVEARTAELTTAMTLLQRRDAILQAVSSIGARLLRTADWRQEIDHTLAVLGQATDVDRIVVYRGYVENDIAMRVNIHHEWVAEGVESIIDDSRFEDVDVAEVGFREQLAGLMHKRPFFGYTASLPPAQQRLPRLMGVESYLFLPIFVRDRLWGSASLHVVRPGYDWDMVEIEVLQTAIDMLGTAVERQEAVQALELSQVRLNQAQHIAHLGNWERDFTNGTLHWSDEIYRIFGLPIEGTTATLELFYAMVHPDDEVMVRVAVDRALRTHETYNIDHRIVLPDGTIRVVHEQAEVTIDNHGTPLHLRGTIQDISERKQIEMALQQSTERLTVLHEIDRAILAAESPEAIAQVTLAYIGRLVQCPRRAIMVFDSQAEEMLELAVDSDYSVEWPVGIRYPITPAFEKMRERLRHGQVCRLTDQIARIPHLAQAQAAGINCIVIVPLVNRDGLIGALSLSFVDVETAEKADMTIVREVADQLTIAIQQAQLHEQIKLHAEELEQHVAERTAELEAANRVKDEFVSNVSHELRTPITSLKLYHDLLARRPDRFETYMTTLRRETDRLNDLIENLLTLSRLDQGRVTASVRAIDLNALVEEYIEDRMPLANGRNLQLLSELVCGLPVVDGDPNLLGQALSVLLTNAFNYTPPGGQVVLSTHVAQFDGQVWAGFCVRDTGPGIPPEEHDKLFTRFYRGKVGRESGVSGTGLGLAIAQQIVTQHGGRITLNSDGVLGHGATFCVWLPADV